MHLLINFLGLILYKIQHDNKLRKCIIYLKILFVNYYLQNSIYFLIISYEAYESDKNNASFNYYMASVLSFTAQSIRISTLLKYPKSVTGIEDVI